MKDHLMQRERHFKKMNDSLRVQLLADGLEISSNFVIIFDEDRLICWVNKSFEILSGFTLQEIIGKNVRILFSEQGNPAMFFSATKNLLNRQEWRGEIIAKRKNGQESVDGVAVTPIFDEISGKNYFLVIGRDITEKIKAREALQAAQEAQRKAEKMFSVGAMASGIAHEINQPLNAIKVISDGILYLLSQGEKLQADEFADSIKQIGSQADRIVKITKLLRSCVKQEEVTMTPCDVNAAVEMALQLTGSLSTDHGVIVQKHLQKELPLVTAFFTGLEEVVTNLLVNAVQALDSINKADKRIVISTYFTDQVVLEISDNGPGIDPTLEKDIFKAFVSTKTHGDNMGLGLAIVRTIVNSFFGTIKVLPNAMGGATFVVSLPAVLEKCEADFK